MGIFPFMHPLFEALTLFYAAYFGGIGLDAVLSKDIVMAPVLKASIPFLSKDYVNSVILALIQTMFDSLGNVTVNDFVGDIVFEMSKCVKESKSWPPVPNISPTTPPKPSLTG